MISLRQSWFTPVFLSRATLHSQKCLSLDDKSFVHPSYAPFHAVVESHSFYSKSGVGLHGSDFFVAAE